MSTSETSDASDEIELSELAPPSAADAGSEFPEQPARQLSGVQESQFLLGISFDDAFRAQEFLTAMTRLGSLGSIRLRDAEDQIEILMLRDGQSKVVVALMKFAQQEQLALQSEGRPAGNGQISLTLSPLELSAQVGLDVDTVKRIVAQLREAGHIRIQDERVEVPNLDSLRDLYSLLGTKDQLRGQAQGASRTRAR